MLKHEVFKVAADLSQAKRRSALELQIRRWLPFKNSRYAVQWVGNRASVFAWDSERVRAAIEGESLDPIRAKIVPEPFMRTAGQNGIRLVAVSDGYEAQIWDEGLLAASRWWPAMPTLTDWAMMLRLARATGAGQAVKLPAPVEAPILSESWALRRDVFEDTLSLLEVPRYRIAAAIAVGALPLFLGTQWVTTATANATLTNARARVLQASDGVRRERQAALANLDEIDDLLALEPYPSQFAVMTRAAQLIQPVQGKVVDWSFDGGAVEFSVQGAGPGEMDATFVIESFEKDDLFESVSAKTLSQPTSVLRVHASISRLPGRG